MPLETSLKMHQDHRDWEAENSFWRDQVRAWQGETTQALADLKRVEQALREHEQQLEVHAAAVRLYGQACSEHEHQLVQAARSEELQKGASTPRNHCAEAYDHAHERDLHESIKRNHHTLMARLSMLLKSLDMTK